MTYDAAQDCKTQMSDILLAVCFQGARPQAHRFRCAHSALQQRHGWPGGKCKQAKIQWERALQTPLNAPPLVGGHLSTRPRIPLARGDSDSSRYLFKQLDRRDRAVRVFPSWRFDFLPASCARPLWPPLHRGCGIQTKCHSSCDGWRRQHNRLPIAALGRGARRRWCSSTWAGRRRWTKWGTFSAGCLSVATLHIPRSVN